MSTTLLPQQSNEPQCCIDYCIATHTKTGEEVVNNYKCNQQPFTLSDIWMVRRKARQFKIKTDL